MAQLLSWLVSHQKQYLIPSPYAITSCSSRAVPEGDKPKDVVEEKKEEKKEERKEEGESGKESSEPPKEGGDDKKRPGWRREE